jgi:uncharacterized protein
MSDAKSPPELSMDEILATIRRIISEDEQTGSPPTARGAASNTTGAAAHDGDDVLELTEAINEDGSTRHLAPIAAAGRREGLIPGSPPVAAPPEPEPEPQLQAAPSPPPAPEQPVPPSTEPSLSPNIALGAGDRTLEEIVREMLRPLLQTWLDQNLPPLVERFVQAEIARVGREAGAG